MAGTSRELLSVMEENDNRLDSSVRIKTSITPHLLLSFDLLRSLSLVAQ